MKRTWIKWVVAALAVVGIILYSALFSVYEGDVALVTRFGAVREIVQTSGLHTKLPWPFEKVYTYDGRSQFFDTSYAETLTKDKKNVVIQAYVVWHISDPQKFMESTGNEESAISKLNSLVTNAKNAVLGKYDFSALVSTDAQELKLDEIEQAILDNVRNQANENYGLEVEQIGFIRIGLPESNINDVFDQMRSERQIYISRSLAEGERDASIIMNETDVEVAQIKAEGVEQAATIMGETEKEIAQIYADAQNTDPDFYTFLKDMETLEEVVGYNTTLIFSTKHPLFDVLDWDFGEGSDE